ncbi:MAG: 50S ribosomal protein L23 [Nevskiaceae bacterium]|nr:MAG: 50S ribosomal protein L23 [Nevskiaceae bacterium]TBR72951.1 MAG: 50S ribosomal protein L23 [Nevskiaceae bacterium]
MSKLTVAGERLHQVIVAPLVSEKATRSAEKHNIAVFKVLRDADKAEVKKAVELLFSVQVKSVQTLIVKGKARRFGRTLGRRSDWKKAYVRLAEGQQIDLVGNAGA